MTKPPVPSPEDLILQMLREVLARQAQQMGLAPEAPPAPAPVPPPPVMAPVPPPAPPAAAEPPDQRHDARRAAGIAASGLASVAIGLLVRARRRR